MEFNRIDIVLLTCLVRYHITSPVMWLIFVSQTQEKTKEITTVTVVWIPDPNTVNREVVLGVEIS